MNLTESKADFFCQQNSFQNVRNIPCNIFCCFIILNIRGIKSGNFKGSYLPLLVRSCLSPVLFFCQKTTEECSSKIKDEFLTRRLNQINRECSRKAPQVMHYTFFPIHTKMMKVLLLVSHNVFR